jgi:hypothetical protein
MMSSLRSRLAQGTPILRLKNRSGNQVVRYSLRISPGSTFLLNSWLIR